MRLKLISFNVRRTAKATDKHHWSHREDAIRAFFRAEDPDIVGTQEMIDPYIRKAEGLLPDFGWVGEGRRGGEEGEYTAIFYRKDRFRVLNWGTFWLSKTPDVPGSRSWFSVFPRTCTWAIFQSLITGDKVCVYNTHLDHISMYARWKGLELIRRHIEECMQDCPDVVLMGDFNAKPSSRPLRTLRDGCESLIDCYSISIACRHTPGRTYHAFRGKTKGHPIDYIFASASMAVESVKVVRKQYRRKHLSDHYPIVMVARTVGPGIA